MKYIKITFKSKLILALISLTLVPIIGINIFHYSYSSKEFQRLMKIEAKAIVKKADYEMEYLYNEALATLKGISELDIIKKSITENPNSNSRREIEQLLSNLLNITSIYESYQIISPDGNQIYKEYEDKSIEKVYLKNLTDRKYFINPMRSEKPFLSDVILARATNNLILIVGHPIKDNSGKIIGVISGVIGFNSFSRLTKELNTSPGAYTFITSRNGLLLSHSDNSVVGKKNLFDICTMEPEDIKKIKKENEGMVSYRYNGIDKFLYFHSSINNKFTIYYTIPKSDYFSSINRLRFVLISIAIIVSIFALILALLISTKVNKGIENVTIANAKVEERNSELKSLASKLAKYLSPQLYRSIFSGKRDVKIETYRKKLTVFFSDIKDFAQITDSMQSEALTSLLNEYLNEMSKIAVKYGGTIDKYIGDAIMIFFGDPESRGCKDDAIACVSMAIEMRRTMRLLHRRWIEQGITRPLKIRIGINTGFCTIGNFGSDERLDYTIIGGEVNLASRLESKSDVDKILISHETFALIKDHIHCRYVDDLEIKGFAYNVKTYEVIDFMETLDNRGLIEYNSQGFNLQIDMDKVKDKELMIQNLQETINTLNS